MLNLKIALRFLIHKPLKTFVAVTAIIAGSAVFYFVLNVSSGLKKLVLQLTAENNSHIIVTGDFDYNEENEAFRSNFRNELFDIDKRITDISYSFVVGTNVMYDTKTQVSNSVQVNLKGVDFEVGKNIHHIERRINAKAYNKTPSDDFDSNYNGEIVIGSLLAKTIGFKISSDAIDQDVKIMINQIPHLFKIVAVFESDQHQLSKLTIFTTINTIQTITGLDKANMIDIRVKDPMDSSKVLTKIKSTIDSNYNEANILEWQEGNAYAVNALYIEDVSIFIIQLFTAISITFGVASILTFNIKEKSNQIGILKAMGTNDSNSRNIFLIYAFILTIVGIFFGLLLGDFTSRVFMQVFRRPNSNVPLVSINRGINNIYAFITFLVMGLGNMLASLVPIQSVKKLKIIEVIKND